MIGIIVNSNEKEAEIIIERFKMVDQYMTFDGEVISRSEAVNILNQLASALNNRGCFFEKT